ncbi:MAG: TonB family protein [Dokdonella sp.]
MRTLFISSLVLIPLLCSCATTKDKTSYQERRLGAPSVSEADKCLDRIETAYAPRYPGGALSSGIEGWVVVALELSSDGKVLSRKIEVEKPTGVFGQAALDSIDKTVFNKADGARSCRMLSTYYLN